MPTPERDLSRPWLQRRMASARLPSPSADSTHQGWCPALFADFRGLLERDGRTRDLLEEAAVAALVPHEGRASAADHGAWRRIGVDGLLAATRSDAHELATTARRGR